MTSSPERLAGDTAYGSGANLNWLVNEAKTAPHIPVVDKSKRENGTFSREDFTFDKERNVYICPASKILTTTGKVATDGETCITGPGHAIAAATQVTVLYEGAVAQNPAQHLRGGPSTSIARAAIANELRCCLPI